MEPFRVEVDVVPGASGAEPVAFRLRARAWRVAVILDRWQGTGYEYVKLRAEDGTVAILRHEETAGAWTLILLEAGPDR